MDNILGRLFGRPFFAPCSIVRARALIRTHKRDNIIYIYYYCCYIYIRTTIAKKRKAKGKQKETTTQRTKSRMIKKETTKDEKKKMPNTKTKKRKTKERKTMTKKTRNKKRAKGINKSEPPRRANKPFSAYFRRACIITIRTKKKIAESA